MSSRTLCLVAVLCVTLQAGMCMGQEAYARGGDSIFERFGFGTKEQPSERERKKDEAEQRHERRGEDGFRALYTMNRDGTQVKYLCAAPGMISSSSPEVSRDGTMVAFDAVPEVGELSDAHIFVYAMKGAFKGMFRDLGCGNVPTWSPDGERIAFMVNGGNPAGMEYGTWIMNSDGSDKKRISNGWYPRFSPDGKKLQIWAFQEEPTAIDLFDVATEEIEKVDTGSMAVEFGGSTWSPCGKSLVFIGRDDDGQHLAIVDLKPKEGKDPVRRLYSLNSDSKELIGPPTWSPDGKQVVFAIQERPDAPSSADYRRWDRTYLYSIAAEVPSGPKLLQPDRPGRINRSPMFAPCGKTIVFSSER
ncbi:MAG: hypothetical protein ACOY3P_10740 [Planctomycetota bacterium]